MVGSITLTEAASLFGTGPVFGFNANEGLGWIHNGGGRELFEELQNKIMKVNIKSFFAMPMPTQPLGWFKKPIKSAADMRGLKYRTVGLAADITINELNYEFDVMLHSRKYDTRQPPELLETLFLREAIQIANERTMRMI